MWLGTLFTSAAASFGRLLLVGLLPNAILVAYVWLLLALHAFTNRGQDAPLTLMDLGQVNFRTDAGGLLLFVLLVVLLTAVVQPFQVRVVRIVEGYWRRENWLYRFAVGAHQRRSDRLRQQAISGIDLRDNELLSKPADEQIAEQRRARRLSAAASRAKGKLKSYPPPDADVLPTMLGNVLRRGERIAGERYALDTISSWPRLYPYVGDKVATEFDSETDGVDASVNLALVFIVMSVLGFVAFANDRWMLIVPVLLVLLALAAYRAAISSARQLGLTMVVAYDLYRFDLIRGLHLELPVTPEAEAERNRVITRFFKSSDDRLAPPEATVSLHGLTYRHPAD